jgi:cold shock CspA family protein
MGKSQETWNKKEREKKKRQKQKDKLERKQERKEETGKEGVKQLEDMMAYIDEYGNLSATPPDPRKRIQVNAEDISLDVSRPRNAEDDEPRNGKVTFFNTAKGFGFIKDSKTLQSFFVHAQQFTGTLMENDKVSFEVGMGDRGPMAVNVKKTV